MKRLAIILAAVLCFALSYAAAEENQTIYDKCEKISAETKSAELIPSTRYVVDVEDPTAYTWSTSNEDVIPVFENGTFYSLNAGKATLTGKAKDGSKTIKISLSVSIPYVSSKDIVVDSPEGAELIAYLGSGFITTSYTGDDCFAVEQIGDSFSSKYKILPKKPGKGAIVYEINFKKRIKVNITVTKSAMITEEERQAIMKNAGQNAKIGIVTKGVNIRAEATSESSRVGSAKAGEELVITQEYYTEKWHQILYEGELCYVSAKYVKIQ